MRITTWVKAFPRFSVAAVLILASSTAFAGENIWTSNGPLGSVTALASDSTGTYAGTYLEGRSAAYRSLDHGASWTAIGEAPEATSISTLTVDPTNSARVYATVSFLSAIPSLVLERIFRSEDRGSSWVQVGLFNGTILDLAIRPEDPETLYAGGLACYCVGFPCLYPNECSASVMKSVDAGVSWVLLGTRLGGSIVTAVALDPHDPARIYAGRDAGASVSSDNGAHWSAINSGLEGCPSVLALAIRPDGTLFAGTGRIASNRFDCGGVFRSSNGGRTWTDTSLAPHYVTSLAIDPSNEEIVYAGTGRIGFFSPDAGVFRSADGGDNWTAIGAIPGQPNVSELVVEPTGRVIHAGTGAGVFDYEIVPGARPPVLVPRSRETRTIPARP
jgi:hypothetical protein